jgi:hypothetical protein
MKFLFPQDSVTIFGHHNVFIFQVFVGLLIPAFEHLKEKNSNKW